MSRVSRPAVSCLYIEPQRYEKLTKWHEDFFFKNCENSKKCVFCVAEDRMEIDFLIRKSKITNRHNISPIEVKSGDRYSLTSLEKCIRKYGPYLSTPFVLHDGDVKEENDIVYLPLYMASLL